MSVQTDAARANINQAFEQIVAWLELQRPMPDGVTLVLRDQFRGAVENPDSTYMVVASPRNLVQVFGGKAICLSVPEAISRDQSVEGLLQSKFGVTDAFCMIVKGLEGEAQALVYEQANRNYALAPADRRMEIAA